MNHTHGLSLIRVFGGVAVEAAGDPVSIGGLRQHRLLALLVIKSGSVVTLDWLAEHLWADADRPSETVAPLRTYLSRLRHSLPESARGWIETQTGGYMMIAPDEALEHRRFELLRAQATRARSDEDPLAALGFLDEALGLWRGDPFRELEDFDWARAAIEQLRLDRLEMLEERWEVSLALGRHTQITGELAAFTAQHGLRDRAVRQHALALHRSGRSAEALRSIDSHRRMLAEESGLDPSPGVVELESMMLSGDASLEVEKVGRPLRGYRLLEEIGNGAFSVVWRGVQPSVGRDVAIKQIRSELASQPQFIRRFEAEAQLIAAIEHPHVVPLIDFWRDPDSAYLVMRWLRGGTLERRLDDGPLSVERTLTLARQIGGALSSAHAQGIVHRDVKPANILFDNEDNAFLTDFGIASETAQTSVPEAALSPGSPAYAAPEQMRHEPFGPEADVFSFGVVLRECMGGSDIPAWMEIALARAAAEGQGDRYGSVAKFVEDLEMGEASEAGDAVQGDHARGAVGPSSAGTATTRLPLALPLNPYKGLRAFDQGDSEVFFGRERLTHELIARLSATSIISRCLVVVGPSGSGKSSLVRAGLVPAVRAGKIEGSSDWFTSIMVPGSDPYESLESAILRVAVDPPRSLATQLRDGERGILRSLRHCLGAHNARLLLTIDQFEELFSGAAAAHADAFLDALTVAIHDPASPLRLVATLRADYYDRPLSHPGFAPIVKQCAVEVTPLAGDELERAIVEPARRMGVEFEPGVVARIAAETAGHNAVLPLLQYTLSELFDRRSGEVVTLQAYEEIGGLGGALTSRAEGLYTEADSVHRAAIRTTFGRLTDPTLDSADIRRRVPLADVAGQSTITSVLERFGAARLLTFDRDVRSREPTVEVAHEALLREWPRLVEWLKDDLDVLRSAAGLGIAANAWDDGGRTQSDLYRGWRLEHAVDMALVESDRLRPLDRDFVDASRLAAASTKKIEEHRVHRLHRLVAGIGVALVVALIAGGLAFLQSTRADEEARRAEAQATVAEQQTVAAIGAVEAAELATLISRSSAQVGDNPDLAVLLALEAHRRSPGPETDQAVLNALGSSTFANRVISLDPLNGASGVCEPTTANAHGTREFGVADGQLVSRDPSTGLVVDHGPAPAPCVVWLGDAATNRRVAFAEDGLRMWLGPLDGAWEFEQEFAFPTFLASNSLNEAHRVLLDTHRSFEGGVVTVIDDRTGESIGPDIIALSGLDAAIMSEDGSLVAASFSSNPTPEGSGLIVIADGATGQELLRFTTVGVFHSLAFDAAAGELVAGGSNTSTITTFDIATGEVLAEVNTRSTANRPDGGLGIRSDGLVVSVSRGQIEVLDRRTGPVNPAVEVRGIAESRVRPDGAILTFDDERRATIIDPKTNALVEQAWPLAPFAEVYFADGRAGIVREPSGEAEIVNLATGERSTYAADGPEDGSEIPAAAFPDGSGYWTVDQTPFLRRWEGTDLIASVNLGGLPFTGNRYGNRFAVLASGWNGYGVAKIVDTDLDSLRVVLSVPAPFAAVAHPSIDGGIHIFDRDGRIHSYDADGVLVGEMLIPERDLTPFNIPPKRVVGAQVSMDRSGLLTMIGVRGEVLVIDPVAGEVEVLPIIDSGNAVGFARGGELLVIVTDDGTVSLWDRERGQSAGRVWTGSGAANSGPPWYDEATDSVWAATSGKLIRIPLDPAGWVERSCEIVGRGFTKDEWDRFVPGDEPLQDACA